MAIESNRADQDYTLTARHSLIETHTGSFPAHSPSLLKESVRRGLNHLVHELPVIDLCIHGLQY